MSGTDFRFDIVPKQFPLWLKSSIGSLGVSRLFPAKKIIVCVLNYFLHIKKGIIDDEVVTIARIRRTLQRIQRTTMCLETWTPAHSRAFLLHLGTISSLLRTFKSAAISAFLRSSDPLKSGILRSCTDLGSTFDKWSIHEIFPLPVVVASTFQLLRTASQIHLFLHLCSSPSSNLFRKKLTVFRSSSSSTSK